MAEATPRTPHAELTRDELGVTQLEEKVLRMEEVLSAVVAIVSEPVDEKADELAGTTESINTRMNIGVFGDGYQGDRTITDEQSLPDNAFYRNLTIKAGGKLKTQGWALHVSNILLIEGEIDFSGAAGSSTGVAGAGVAREYLGGSNAGGAGNTGAGSNGAAVSNSLGGVGGIGGNGTTGIGGQGGASTAFPDENGGVKVIHQLVPMITGESQGELIETGTGGGGGSGNGTKKGGGGGASGGYIGIFARTIQGTGAIKADGGIGGDGEAGGNTGGGGGGGGGLVAIATETEVPSAITITAAGGAGGQGTGTGTDGSPGEDGVIVKLLGVK